MRVRKGTNMVTRHATFWVNLLGISLVCAACGDGDDPSNKIDDACNPLGGGVSCMMPWPSSVYLDQDASMPSGFRVSIPLEAMPVNVDGYQVDPTPWNRYDGFGPSGVILAAFPSGVSADGLPPQDDPSVSLGDDSPILLLNMETGDRVAFFAEVDLNTEKQDRRALIIHPLERMQPGARHLVAIRDTVKGPGGVTLERSEAFAALLDGTRFSHPLFDKVAPSYDAIFSAIEAEGVSRDELVLAWDFVTATDENLTSDLLSMTQQALPAMGQSGANLTFEATEVGANPATVFKLFNGTHDSPNFLTDGESDFSIINRDGSDRPVLDGTYDANFSAIIPACVQTAQLPVPVVIFGHGLFGSAEDYLDDNLAQDIANDYCFVILAGDWIGLTNRQVVSAAYSSNDLNRSLALVEKLEQAVINFIALTQLAIGPLSTAPEFRLNGEPIFDTSRVYYLGASLGGIMGGTFMAYDPVIERGALGVPGGAWSLMIERSFAWTPLQVASIAAYEDQYLYQQNVALLALSMERSDPVTTSNNVINDPLPGVPAKQLLLWEAMEDSLVSNLSTEMMGRSYGIPVCGPSLRVPYGMQEQLAPDSSGLTIYHEGVAPRTTTNVPPLQDNGTHGGINERRAVLDQVEHFFLQGEVINQCRSGDTAVPCDCTVAGVCD